MPVFAFSLGAGVTPADNFLQAFCAALLKQAHMMARVLKFVDVGPNLSLPRFLMDGRFPTGGAARMQFAESADGCDNV